MVIEKSTPSGEMAGEKNGRITPAMKQFYAAKKQYPDCVIFFRMGDFYETFCEDAEICSRELDITLTSRGRSPDGQDIPLAGVPHHAVESYLSRMISKGYKVAICEQMEDPKKAKGIVKRDVIRVVTPGTVIDAALLPTAGARYLLSVSSDAKKKAGLAFLDISTGDFRIAEVSLQRNAEALRSEVAKYHPIECILPEGMVNLQEMLGHLIPLVSPVESSLFDHKKAEDLLCSQFGTEHLDAESSAMPFAVSAAGAALAYAQKTQFDPLSHIRCFSRSDESDFLVLDAVTLRNLELVQNIRDRTEEGTLVASLDFTSSPMGKRLIRRWITAPLRLVPAIEARLDAVEYFAQNTRLRQEARQFLHRFPDLERIAGRISYGNASPRDMLTLCDALSASQEIKSVMSNGGDIPAEICEASGSIHELSDLISLIQRAICDDPPALVRKGGVIRDGYHQELDRLRLITHDGRSWIADLEQKERERTGIKSLKIRYNAVFGYFIEITKANLNLVPAGYERKQTTSTGERFTIPQLREVESEIATADERLLTLEEELYKELLESVRRYVGELQDIAHAIGKIDIFSALAEVALKYQYVRPQLDDGNSLLIREGRHPVVEISLSDGFVPNDAEMSADKDQILIITGANMAGKSTYMRSVALTVVMAQMGSFVPARYAKIGVIDRIFTRVGAFDDLASGQSTFMVEMVELASILNNATEKSLVILDEIGRGTSTLDGYCIAKAVLEHLHGKRSKGPKTLFATHFHELIGIENDLKRVKNCHFAVKETDKDVIFLRKLVPGATDRSYGIHVATLAGVPEAVTTRAEDLMSKIIRGEESPGGNVRRYTQMILLDDPSGPDPVREELSRLNVNDLTPMQALSYLAELQKKAADR